MFTSPLNKHTIWKNNLVDTCGCHKIFCDFVDYLIKNNLVGIFDFPQWDDRWYKGFRIENTVLSEDQILSITNYLNRITSQIAVINLYKNDSYEDKRNVINWTYKKKNISKFSNRKQSYHYWEPYDTDPSAIGKVKKFFSTKEHQNFNLELFCRHINMCRVLKKYGANKISFYAEKEGRHENAWGQWYSFAYHLVICKNIRKGGDYLEKFLHDKEKMNISKDGCTLYIPISIEPYI